MNRNELIDVLTAVGVAKSRAMGQTDVDIWGGIIGEFTYDEAIQAVTAHLKESPGVWLEPGHVYQRVMSERRLAAMSESREEREARQAALDAAKVDPEILALARAKAIPEEDPKFKRGGMNSPKAVACPWCKARPGQACVEPSSGQPLTRTPFHPGRVEAWGGKTA